MKRANTLLIVKSIRMAEQLQSLSDPAELMVIPVGASITGRPFGLIINTVRPEDFPAGASRESCRQRLLEMHTHLNGPHARLIHSFDGDD
jgi:hypothetical protein